MVMHPMPFSLLVSNCCPAQVLRYVIADSSASVMLFMFLKGCEWFGDCASCRGALCKAIGWVLRVMHVVKTRIGSQDCRKRRKLEFPFPCIWQ